MKRLTSIIVLVLMISIIGCRTKQKPSGQGEDGVKFARSMVEFAPFETMLNILSVIKEIYPDDLIIHKEYFNMIAGNSWISQKIDKGSNVKSIMNSYQDGLSEFFEYRKKYLLYD